MSSRPSLEQFVLHAERFGTGCVFETAERYLGPGELARLRIELDEIDANRRSRSGRFAVGRRRRRTPEETIAAVRQLRSEGLVVGAIAETLGIGDGHVRRCLRESETRRNGVANPRGYAADLALSSEPGLTVGEASPK